MKNIVYPFLLLASFLLTNCKKNEVVIPERGERTIAVNDFDKVDLDGNIVLHVYHVPQPTGEVRINTGKYDWSKIIVRSENGELIVKVEDNIPLTDSVRIEIFVPVLTAIRLQSTQQAVVYWDPEINIASLDIVTEAESKLEIYNLNATSLTSRQEASSDIIISSAVSQVVSATEYTGQITLLDNNTIIIDDQLVVKADSIAINNNTSPASYIVYGNAAAYNLIQTVSFRGEGKSWIQISEMPVKDLAIKLEGESKADVWSTSIVSGTGEGQTVLSYYGNPTVSYNTSGSARIIKLP